MAERRRKWIKRAHKLNPGGWQWRRSNMHTVIEPLKTFAVLNTAAILDYNIRRNKPRSQCHPCPTRQEPQPRSQGLLEVGRSPGQRVSTQDWQCQHMASPSTFHTKWYFYGPFASFFFWVFPFCYRDGVPREWLKWSKPYLCPQFMTNFLILWENCSLDFSIIASEDSVSLDWDWPSSLPVRRAVLPLATNLEQKTESPIIRP